MSLFRRSNGITLAIALLGGACSREAAPPPLVGAWRAQIAFGNGAFAGVRDLEFLYVFNAGGTMTESSNYDAAPPVAPAYGEWRQFGPGDFEARYRFYVTRPPGRLEDLAQGGGWLPAGFGVFTERITLSPDRQAFTSNIQYEAFDSAGKLVAGGGSGSGKGFRIGF